MFGFVAGRCAWVLVCGVLFGGIWCCGFGWFVDGLGAVYLCGLGVVGCCLSDLFGVSCFCEWCFNSVVLFYLFDFVFVLFVCCSWCMAGLRFRLLCGGLLIVGFGCLLGFVGILGC